MHGKNINCFPHITEWMHVTLVAFANSVMQHQGTELFKKIKVFNNQSLIKNSKLFDYLSALEYKHFHATAKRCPLLFKEAQIYRIFKRVMGDQGKLKNYLIPFFVL
jgi:hypothetical protein